MSPRPQSRFTLREPYLGVDLAPFSELPRYREDFAPRLRTLQAAGCQAVLVPVAALPEDESTFLRHGIRCQAVSHRGPMSELRSTLDRAFAWDAAFLVVDSPKPSQTDEDTVVSEFAEAMSAVLEPAKARGIRLLVRNRPGDTIGGANHCRLSRISAPFEGQVGWCIDAYSVWLDSTGWELFVAEASNRIFLVQMRDEWDGVPVPYGTGDLPLTHFCGILDRIMALHGIYFTASRANSNLMDIAIASLGTIQDLVDR